MCLGKSPVCLHSSANGDQHRAKAMARAATLCSFSPCKCTFFWMNFSVSLILSAVSTHMLWGDFFWEGNSGRKCEFLLASGSQEDPQQDCANAVYGHSITQIIQVLATPPSRAAVQKPVRSWTKDRDVSSTGRGTDVGLRRILERQTFYIPFYFASKVISRDTANLLPFMLVNRLTS